MAGQKHTQLFNHQLQEESIFTEAMFTGRERLSRSRRKVCFTPSVTGYMPVVNETFNTFENKEGKLFSKEFPVELFRYYASVLFWLRVIGLKRRLNKILTDAESKVLLSFEYSKFNVPEPIYLALNSIGKIESKIGVDLYPDFPDLATEVVDSIPGSYGKVSVDNHCLYEELPVIGPTIQGIIERISGANPTQPRTYASVFAMTGTEATDNLQGYDQLNYCKIAALNFIHNLDIYEDEQFPSIANTGIDINIVWAISVRLARTKTFKLYSVNVINMRETGTVAQYIKAVPELSTANNSYLCMYSVSEETAAMAGVSMMFGLNQYKESSVEESIKPWNAVLPWSALAFKETMPPPEGYIENRNARRNLPAAFHDCHYKWSGEHSERYRDKVIEKLTLKTYDV